MDPLHSPLTTINLSTTSFPPQKLHYHKKSPFLSSKTSYPLNSFIPSNSFKLKKENSFQVSLSFTQQNSDDLYNNSRLLLPNFSFPKLSFSRITTAASTSTPPPLNSTAPNSSENVHWMVIMDIPPKGFQSKAEIINYYVSILEKALGSEKDAQSCIYDASCDTNFGFCCIVDEETSRFIAGLPGVQSVIPDPDINSVKKDYSAGNFRDVSVSNLHNQTSLLFLKGSKNWLVRVENPCSRYLSKAQAVDSYVNILTKVLGNEKDAQMCLYHVSCQFNFGFCCKLDDESAQELATVPGVISVRPDEHFESENKDYGGDRLAFNASDSTKDTEISKTKLFITGLSFYTSEKTLRAAFEPFGELLEVKVIMDKISKRSKGYAFVEYTTEVAATTALQEMNGKIINGWMIVVDRAKMKPRRSRALSSQDRKFVAFNKLKDAGAVASASAARIYGLNVLAEGIQDDSDNVIRFLMLAREPIIPGSDRPFKTSIVFSHTEGPGALFKALAVFALGHINLTKIESRPLRNSKNGSSTSMADPNAQNALRHVGEFATLLRVLGSYPADTSRR